MLHWAALLGHEAVIQFLLEKNVNINAREEKSGMTTVMKAVLTGNMAIFRLLLQKIGRLDSVSRSFLDVLPAICGDKYVAQICGDEYYWRCLNNMA